MCASVALTRRRFIPPPDHTEPHIFKPAVVLFISIVDNLAQGKSNCIKTIKNLNFFAYVTLLSNFSNFLRKRRKGEQR